MSHAVLVVAREEDQPATVVPEEGRGVAETAGARQANQGTNKSKGRFFNALASLGNGLVIAVIAIAYPVTVLPFYRAESTTEYVNDVVKFASKQP